MWELVYGPPMFGLGCICGFFWSRYLQYGTILKAWNEVEKGYKDLREIEDKVDDILERKKVKGQSLGT